MYDITHLLTDRLLLRRPVASDTDGYFAIYGDPQTNMFNPAGPLADRVQAEARMASMLDRWEAHGWGTWAVSDQECPDELLGFGGLSDHLYGTERRTNLGFRFAAVAWGKGYATELAASALQTAWRIGLDEVWGSVRENNLASRRVLEKIGMLQVDKVQDPSGAAATIWYTARQHALCSVAS